MNTEFTDLYKLKCDTLRSLGKCLGVPGVSKLKKAELVNAISQNVKKPQPQINQVGGDTCVYPCPDSPDGRHKFETRGYVYNLEGEMEDLEECQHCGCIKLANQ